MRRIFCFGSAMGEEVDEGYGDGNGAVPGYRTRLGIWDCGSQRHYLGGDIRSNQPMSAGNAVQWVLVGS